ncbi:MAG TPA: branched-chain amino acid ABC transporter permease [Firmicutes bacterium]|nr:branched-chain amino acid ABC transporter permease [Bacillota bacterium]
MIIQQLVNGFSVGAVYALIAVGFGLVFNVLKFSNFSHGSTMGISAYIAYLFAMKFHLSIVPTVSIGTIAGGICAVLVELIAFRPLRKRGGQIVYFFVTSITMLMLLENILVIFFGDTFYAFPKMIASTAITVAGVSISTLYLVMLGCSVCALALLSYWLKYTKMGVAIRAASCAINTCNLMGANVDAVISWTFFVAGLMAGLSGSLLGISYTLYPQIGQIVVKGFIASVVGGLGNLTGAVVGAILLGILEVFFIATIGAGLTPAATFAIMVLFLFLRPQGVAGTIVRDKA